MMKIVLLLALAFAFVVADSIRIQQFSDFKVKFNKNYATKEEHDRRFEIFKQNVQEAEERTRKDRHATFGVTKFSDLTKAEFKNKYLMKVGKPDFPHAPVANISVKALPTSFDWRDKSGIVSPVKDQGQCGSCWDFSATETVESVWARGGKTLVPLSTQQVVDCDTTDDGCDGGWPYNAYQYIISAGGQDSEKSYPYTAQDGTCSFNSANIAAKISGWQYVTQSQDETAMMNFLYTNSPLSVCVDAETWSSYTGGVITPSSNCGNSIDHCVQITGWSTVNGVQAWHVRNSWGASWGVNGFIYVQIGSDVCSIAEVVTVPKL
jgi:C1A family cysteine protease